MIPLRHANSNRLALIGAGLVGGAVLQELVLGWVKAHSATPGRELQTKASTADRLHLDTIHITTATEAAGLAQLHKIKTVLGAILPDGVTDEARGVLTVHGGGASLRIEAEPLNILPVGLTADNVEDEMFRRQSALFTYLQAKRPRFLVIGANLASMMAYGMRLTQDQTEVLSWLLMTLKHAVDAAGVEVIAIIGTTALGGAWHQPGLDPSKLSGNGRVADGEDPRGLRRFGRERKSL